MPFAVSAATAGLIAAGVGAAGAVAGGVIASQGAKSAASKQAGAAQQAAQTQSDAAIQAAQIQADASNRAADLAQQNFQATRADLLPYREAGTRQLGVLEGRLPELSTGYTAPAPAPFSFTPDQATLESMPGYKFTREQGLQGVQNAASARGLGVSGAALKSAAQYSTGLADSTWKDLFNSRLSEYNAKLSGYNTDFNVDQANKTNAFNKLLGLVGAGQSSAAQTGAFGQQATQNAGNFLTAGANAQAQGINTAGAAGAAGINSAANASAAGTVASSNAVASGLNGFGNSVQNAYFINKLLGNQAAASPTQYADNTSTFRAA